MTDERRYQEEEIREIFALAASDEDSRRPSLSSAEGLTLAELQEIGSEVDLAPERIAQAASALEVRGSVLPRRTHLGMPISVGRIVDLPRSPTDREWELLVTELRETFNARGKVTSHGSLREWTNGNLHAYVEPTETGHRLRMGTLKGSARALPWLGVGGLGIFALAIARASGSSSLVELLPVLIMLGLGGAAWALSLFRLPRWAREREEQMDHIATVAQALIGSEPKGEDPS